MTIELIVVAVVAWGVGLGMASTVLLATIAEYTDPQGLDAANLPAAKAAITSRAAGRIALCAQGQAACAAGETEAQTADPLADAVCRSWRAATVS